MVLHGFYGFICMIGESCLLMLMNIAVCQTRGTSAPEYVGCILKQSSWINRDYLLVEWKIPEEITQMTNQSDIKIEANWYMEENYGNCSELTITSCKMIRLDNNSVNLYHDFYLTVTMVTNNEATVSATWRMNTTKCRQPPKIGSISAVALNSSCFDVRWGYINNKTNDQHCNPLNSKVYRLRYKESYQGTDAWVVHKVGPTSSCIEIKILCGLIPYTFYDIGVECRITVNNGIEYGHWSEISKILMRTDEDVPSASPEVTEGGFSYARKDCEIGQTRNIDFFWKSLPVEFRNGKVLGFKIDIYQTDTLSGIPVQSYSVYGEGSIASSAALLCSSSYNVTLRAFTSKGASETYSSTFIPFHSSVLDIDVDVVPVSLQLSESIDIRWVFKGNTTYNITSYTVYWCWKTLSGKCQSRIGWTDISAEKRHYSLPTRSLTQPIHKYLFGISVQSKNISSGIMWSSCLYEEDKDVDPPKNVRFMTSTVEGSLLVQWDKPSCDGPYIRKYVAHLCPFDRTAPNNCSEVLTTEADGKERSIQFTGLDPSRQYRVSVRALTLSTISSVDSKFITGHPYAESPGLSKLAVVMIVLAGILALGGMILVIFKGTRRLKNYLNPDIPDIPDIYGQQMQTMLQRRDNGHGDIIDG